MKYLDEIDLSAKDRFCNTIVKKKKNWFHGYYGAFNNKKVNIKKYFNFGASLKSSHISFNEKFKNCILLL